MRKLFVAATLTGALVGLAAGARAQGFEPETIHSYDVDVAIEPSGSIVVTETIDYDFGSFERHGIYREIPERLSYDDTYDRLYPIEVLSVTATGGAPAGYVIEREEGLFRIRIGDPDREISGGHTYTIVYRVWGALNGFRDHDELYWNAVGGQWAVGIERASVAVTAPAAIQRVACFAGPVGSVLECHGSKVRGSVATFAHSGLYAYEGFTVVVALPKGAVPEPRPILEERWSLRRAFGVTPLTVSATALLFAAAIGGFAAMFWRTGRDRRFAGSAVDVVMGSASGEEETVPVFDADSEAPVEFEPPEELRPGQIGTLMDEIANPLDVTATIIDLAVRRYLVIEEIPKKWLFGKPDWKLIRLKEADEGLLEYERLLLDGLFEGGAEVKLSDLKKKFVERLQKVQDALYRDAVKRKWFTGRPDKVRQRWTAIGVGVALGGAGLEWAAIRWTRLALLPLPLILAGLLLLFGSKWMPRRTAKGTAMVRRVRGFRRVIDTAETHFARFAEKENLFTRYLPYAIVFGLTEKWAKAFEALGEQQRDDMSWYVSSRPFVWSEFGNAMDGFAVTTSGTITSTPGGSGGSGFGGGSSGGGGGGGGGGSW